MATGALLVDPLALLALVGPPSTMGDLLGMGVRPLEDHHRAMETTMEDLRTVGPHPLAWEVLGVLPWVEAGVVLLVVPLGVLVLYLLLEDGGTSGEAPPEVEALQDQGALLGKTWPRSCLRRPHPLHPARARVEEHSIWFCTVR